MLGPYWALCGLLERYAQLQEHEAGETEQAPREATLANRFPLAAYLNPGKARDDR